METTTPITSESMMQHPYLKSLIVNPIQYIIGGITDGAFWKTFVATLLYLISTFIYSDVEAFSVLIVFVFIDWVTGIWKVFKTKPTDFSSSRFRDTAIKGLFYVILVAMTYALNKLAPIFSVIQLDKWMLTYLCLTELISVMENITSISGIQFPTSFVKLVNKLRDRKPRGR